MSRSWTTHGRLTEYEDRARILEAEFAIKFELYVIDGLCDTGVFFTQIGWLLSFSGTGV